MELFKGYKIDLEKGTIYSTKINKEIGNSVDKHGYHKCNIHDCYGNVYYYVSNVIIAEGLNMPKHLWPIDEQGRIFEVDHITPIINGGTDSFNNLRLISKKDNSNTPLTKENKSKAKSGENNYWFGKKFSNAHKKKLSEAKPSKQVFQYGLDGELIAVWESAHEAERELGFSKGNIRNCCEGGYFSKTRNKWINITQYNGYKWSYK